MKILLLAVGRPGLLFRDAILEYEQRAARYWTFQVIDEFDLFHPGEDGAVGGFCVCLQKTLDGELHRRRVNRLAVVKTDMRAQLYLPGEIIGLNAISQSRYPCNAVALDSVMLCRFSFPNIAALATRMPGLQQQLFRLLSLDIGKASLLAGNFTADERMAAFLISISRRYAARGFSASRFRLTMSRADIANYLRLAAETVSRVFRRFQDEGLIQVDRREIELRNPEAVEEMARNVLRE